MAHPEQKKFCKWVKRQHPKYFCGTIVVDVGSLDINGSNRYLFSRFLDPCLYVGIDIVKGDNVDYVGRAHDLLPIIHKLIIKRTKYARSFQESTDIFKPDVIISTECLEHDQYWKQTMQEMYRALKPGGMILLTAAGEGREEHGTTQCHGWCSPGTNDYYRNVTPDMIEEALIPSQFSTYYIGRNTKSKDIYFYGIKR